jgi:hypothetical protein
MPGYCDIYALSAIRTADVVERFLNRFAPQREAMADEYEVPRYSDSPAIVFRRDTELVAYCVAHTSEPHSMYWRRLGAGDPAHVMVFFTPDEGLILGLSVVAESDHWLAKLLAFAGSDVGCVLFEDPPPDTARDFRALAASSD